MYLDYNMSEYEISDSDGGHDDDEFNFTGKLLNNKYAIIYKLGYGSYSSVYLCCDIKTKKYYAIKIQNVESYKYGKMEVNYFKTMAKQKCVYINELVDSFEIDALALNEMYEGVDIVFDFEEMDDDHKNIYVCMVFNLMAGNLCDLLSSPDYENGLPVNMVLDITKQILIALNTMNKKCKLMHTDIKPENVLIQGINKRDGYIINTFKKFNFDNKLKMEKKRLTKMQYQNDLMTKHQFAVESVLECFVEENNNFEDIDDDIIIEQKDIKAMKTKLSDYGTCTTLDSNDFKIQTRYYRSPETILNYKLFESTDIWSLGCTLYELLTNDVLFNAKPNRFLNTDRCHLYMIQSMFGKIPDNFIENSAKKNIFFRNSGNMKGVNSIKYKPVNFKEKIRNNKLNDNVSDQTIDYLNDLLTGMLEIDPNKRPCATKCLEHKLFK